MTRKSNKELEQEAEAKVEAHNREAGELYATAVIAYDGAKVSPCVSSLEALAKAITKKYPDLEVQVSFSRGEQEIALRPAAPRKATTGYGLPKLPEYPPVAEVRGYVTGYADALASRSQEINDLRDKLERAKRSDGGMVAFHPFYGPMFR